MNLNFLNAFLSKTVGDDLNYSDRLKIAEEPWATTLSTYALSEYLKQNCDNSPLLTDLLLLDNIDQQIEKLQKAKQDYKSVVAYMKKVDEVCHDLSMMKIDNETGTYTPLKFQIMRVNKNYYKIVRR